MHEQYVRFFYDPLVQRGCDDVISITEEQMLQHYTKHRPCTRRTLRADILALQHLQDHLRVPDPNSGAADASASKQYVALCRSKLDLLVQYQKACENVPSLPPPPNLDDGGAF